MTLGSLVGTRDASFLCFMTFSSLHRYACAAVDGCLDAMFRTF